MVDVQTHIKIKCPVHIVADFSSNPDNATKWYVNIKSTKWISDPPLRIGSRIRFSASFMGKKLTYIYEVTEYEVDKILVMKTAEGPFPMETIYTWEKISEGVTLMTLRNRGTPTGFSGIVVKLMKQMMRRVNRKDLKALKNYLEAN